MNFETSELQELNLNLPFPNKTSLSKKKTLNLLSLFSGCGGMDLGFEGNFWVPKGSINTITNPHFVIDQRKEEVLLAETAFKLVFANDILKEAKHTWIHNFQKRGYEPSIFHEQSIVDLVKAHQASAAIFPDNIAIVTGGFPCQDFSLAGKRNGFNSHKDHTGKIISEKENNATEETRGKLYMWMKNVIEITQPNIFIAENVKGLVSLRDVKEIIQHDFASAAGNGYLVLSPRVLHAANYGVAQSRERVIFIGIKKSALKTKALTELSKETINPKFDPYPSPSHAYGNIKAKHLMPHQTLANLFKNLPEPQDSEDPSHRYFSKAKYMGKHCQGQSEINLNGVGPTIRAEHHGNIEFRRLSAENGGKYHEELSKGLMQRRLSPRECGLIQSFPKDFDFVIPKNQSGQSFQVSPSAAYKVIGNAVPPLLAYHISKRIEEIWDLLFCLN
jgi:DNA (cytosine-5)-methyltransferase 1